MIQKIIQIEMKKSAMDVGPAPKPAMKRLSAW